MRPSRPATWLAFALGLLVPRLAPGQEVRMVRVGESERRTLESGTSHAYALPLEADQFVSGRADQLSTDVVVRIVGPEGNPIGEFDEPARGPEHFSFSTKGAGTYRIEIRPFNENEPGEYVLVVDRVEPVARTFEGRVDQLLSRYDRPDAPGVQVALARGGETLVSRGYGSAQLEYGIPITRETVFHVASVSKQFTGWVVAMLAERGLLSMDADVRDFLPEMPEFGRRITPDHLVHHTSGLRDQWNLLALAGWRLDDVITTEQVLRVMSKQRELNFEPGAEMLYCNTGFTLLAEIVGRVAGSTFREWTHQNLFEPLGMTRTHFHDDLQHVVPARAYSYAAGPDGSYSNRVLSYSTVGATSLFTTAEDLLLWAANLDEGAVVGGPAVAARIRRKAVLTRGDTLDYGYGISVGTWRGHAMLSHDGGDAGFRSFLGRLADDEISVAVLSNDGAASPRQVASDLLSLLFPDAVEPAAPAPAAQAVEPAAPVSPAPAVEAGETEPPPTGDLAGLEGRYRSPELETEYMIRADGDHLVASHQRHADIELRLVGEDAFQGSTWFFGRTAFERGAEGRGVRMRVSSGRVRNVLFERVEP